MGNTCCTDEKESSQMVTTMKHTGKETKTQDSKNLRSNINLNLNGSQIDKNHAPQSSVASTCSSMNELHSDTQRALISLQSFPRDLNSDKINNPELGPYKYPNGDTYEGQYSYGKRDGFGVCISKEGSLYEGYWENDQMEGKGRMIYTNGDVFEGVFKQGLPNGKGELKHSDNTGYEGNWVNGEKEGIGSERWPDGTSYSGGFKNGMKHGKGLFRWPDGTKHEGEFFENRIEGKGIISSLLIFLIKRET